MRTDTAHDNYPEISVDYSDDTLGGRIVHAREILDLSTAQLARRVGVKTATLQAWETDRSAPRSNRLTMLASMLNVSIAWLLVGDGDEPNAAPVVPTVEDVTSRLRHLQQQSLAMSEDIDQLITRMAS